MADIPDRAAREASMAVMVLDAYSDALYSGFDETEMEQRLTSALQPTMEDAFATVVVLLMMQELGRSSDSLRYASVVAADMASRYSVDVARATAKNITSGMRRELAGGADPLDVFSPSGARMIAAGELTRTVTAATRHAMTELNRMGITKASDVTEIWRIDPQSNVCETCLRLNGHPEEVWGPEFPEGPPAHPNCRCHTEFVKGWIG